MPYELSTTVNSLSSISSRSESKLFKNNSILLSVNKQINGLSLILGVFMSINEKFGKWSDMSNIKLPDEHLF